MDNVVGIEHSKKKFYRFTIEVTYINGESEEVECTFFGTSIDNPDFMLFSNAHPDQGDDEADIPDLMINTKNTLRIRTIKIEEIER